MKVKKGVFGEEQKIKNEEGKGSKENSFKEKEKKKLKV